MEVVVRKRVIASPSSSTGSVSSNIGTDYSYTAGATFRLYTNSNNAPGTALTEAWATCTVPANAGECTITIPNANNDNLGRRYWVLEEAPVAGSPAARTYSNSNLYVGNYTNPTNQRRLVGMTSAVAPSTTIYMPMTTPGVGGGTAIGSSELSGSGVTLDEGGSFGALANSFKNPQIEPRCFPDYPRIALILDESSSISQSDWNTFRAALVSGSDSVLGTMVDKAAVSILGFGPDSHWRYGANGAVKVTPANFNAIASSIPTTRPALSGTNWDAALSSIDPAKYDMVLMVTDGAPNYILGGVGRNGVRVISNYYVALRALEAPIYAANDLKAAGVRTVVVGVGAGATSAGVANNLRAISGETKGSDYYQGQWDQVKSMMTDVVKSATCTVPISVTKTTVNGTTTTENAAGWQFTATKDGAASISTPATKTTAAGETGAAKWDLTFSQPTGQATSVTLTETVQADWTLTGAACTIGGVAHQVTINGTSVTIGGLTATSGAVNCKFTNEFQVSPDDPPLGALAITKAFDGVPSGSGTSTVFTGTYECTLKGDTAAAGTWTVTGTGAAKLTPDAGSPDADAIPADATCSVTENPPSGSSGLPNSSWSWGTPTVGPAVVIVDDKTVTVTVTNTAVQSFGNFSVTKVVPEGSTADGGNKYQGAWSCTMGSDDVVASGVWGPIEQGETWTSTTDANHIPLGALCAVTSETRPDYPVASDHSFVWDGDPAISEAVVSKATELNVVTVTNKTTRVYGNFSVTKVVPEGSTADKDNTYKGLWTCTLGSETVKGEWGPIASGATWTSTAELKIPLGASCVVTSEVRPDYPVASDHSYVWDGNPGISGPVTVKVSDLNVITVTNKTKRVLGTVTWVKVDVAGAALSGSEWKLTGPGGTSVAIVDCTEAPCTGPDLDPAAGHFKVDNLLWGDYSLTETKAPAGYYRLDKPIDFTIAGGESLTVSLGKISNTQFEGPVIPMTGGIGREFYPMLGLAVLVLGLGASGIIRSRNRRGQGM